MDLCCNKTNHDKKKNAEMRRLCCNWTVFVIGNTFGISYFIVIPSLHQFVTSTTHPSNPNDQPGLGLSEIWYTWIVSIISVGELVGALIVGVTIRYSYVKIIMMLMYLNAFIAGLLYGIGSSGWMLLISRFFQGFTFGGLQVIFRVYLGETGQKAIDTLPPEKQAKSTIKYTSFFFAFTVGSLSMAGGPGLSAVVVHMPVDQFRWSGWYICLHSSIIASIVLLCLREKWTDLNRIIKTIGKKRRWSCRSTTTSTQTEIPSYTIAYIIIAFFLTTWYLAVIESLQNPILSDNFGVTIEYISYIILGSLILYAFGNMFIYCLQRCHIDNRIICLFGMLLLLFGSLIASDFQSINGDPCNQLTDGTIDWIQQKNIELDTRLFKLSSDGSGTVKCTKWTTNNTDQNKISLNATLYCRDDCIAADRNTTCTLLQVLSQTDHYSPSTLLCQPTLWNTNNTSTITFSPSFYCYWPYINSFVSLYSSGYTEYTYHVSTHSDKMSSIGSGSMKCFHYKSLYDNFDSELWELALVTIVTIDAQDNENNNKQCSSISTNCTENSPICLAAEYNIDVNDCVDFNDSCVCELFKSVPNYECFWNPVSRVTGQYCDRCSHVCLSRHYSLNLVQFLVGLCLFTFGYPIVRFTLTLIASDGLGQSSQGLVMGLTIASGALARGTGPLWGVPSYLAVNRRTWLPMLLLSGVQLLVTIFFILLYRTMKRKQGMISDSSYKPLQKIPSLQLSENTINYIDDDREDDMENSSL